MEKDKLIATLQQIKVLADECLASLDTSAMPKRATKKLGAPSHAPKPHDVDFGMPVNPFVRKYGNGLSGQKKFTLLLAWFAKGGLKNEIAISQIRKQWNRMTAKSLLEMEFNQFFPAEARNSDWVELKKKGIYSLRPSWKDIFKNTNG